MIWVLCLSIVLLIACKKEPEARADHSPKPVFRHDANLQIEGVSGQLKADFKVEVVTKDKEVLQGLKYRDSMAPNQGMLFVFEHTDYHSFWMQDTYLSLDMIFIDEDGVIVHIEPDTTPFDENPIFPSRSCKYVLEVLAGTADKLNIKLMDKVKWQELND